MMLPHPVEACAAIASNRHNKPAKLADRHLSTPFWRLRRCVALSVVVT
jgi:hypothetical protein